MMVKKEVRKKLNHARLLKSYGGWMYCDSCGNTVGYLCYSTYDFFRFQFECGCGEHGSIEIGEEKNSNNETVSIELIRRKGRLCCPYDQSPLFSIVEKNLRMYDYKIVCRECNEIFIGSK